MSGTCLTLFVTLLYRGLPPLVFAYHDQVWAPCQIQLSSSDTPSDTYSVGDTIATQPHFTMPQRVLMHLCQSVLRYLYKFEMQVSLQLAATMWSSKSNFWHFFVEEIVFFIFVEYSMKQVGVFDSDKSSWQGIRHTLNTTQMPLYQCVPHFQY